MVLLYTFYHFYILYHTHLYKNYGLEVKAGKSAGNTASTLLEAGLLDFLYHLKGNTYGGITEDGKIQTVPLYLAGKIRFDKGV